MVSRDGLLSIWTSHGLKLGRAERGQSQVISSSIPGQPQISGRGGGFHYYVDGSALSPSIPPVAKSTPKKRSQIIVRSEANHGRRGEEQPIHVFLGNGTSGLHTWEEMGRARRGIFMM